MATGTRKYANLAGGTIAAHDATTSTLTFTTGQEPDFSLASGEYAVLALGSRADFGNPTAWAAGIELVHMVGPYTAGDATATIERGKEGTSGLAHDDGDDWRLVTVSADLTERVWGEPAIYSGAQNTEVEATAAMTVTALAVGGGTVGAGPSLPAGKYIINMTYALKNFANGGTVLEVRSAGGSWTVLDDFPTHSTFNDYFHQITDVYDHPGGTMDVRWRHTHEGSNVTYGNVGDSRWGRAFNIIGPIGGGTSQLAFTGAKASRSTPQTLPAGTYTTIVWNTEHYDSHGFLDVAGANPSRFTVPAGQGGKYLAHWNCYTQTAATLAIAVNGVVQGYVGSPIEGDGATERGFQSEVLDLKPGDYVEFRVKRNTAGDVGADGTYLHASIFKLGQAVPTKPPSAKVTKSGGAAQAIPDGTPTDLTWDEEAWDTDQMVDLASNNARITIKTAGKYRITAGVQWALDVDGYRGIAIHLNGSTDRAVQESPAISAVMRQTVSVDEELEVGDYITARVVAAASGDASVDANATHQTFLSVTRFSD